MHGVRPETLTDRELERYAYLALNAEGGLPKPFAEELLKRFSDRVLEESRRFHTTIPALFAPAGTPDKTIC
jgi:hypothetical protein